MSASCTYKLQPDRPKNILCQFIIPAVQTNRVLVDIEQSVALVALIDVVEIQVDYCSHSNPVVHLYTIKI